MPLVRAKKRMMAMMSDTRRVLHRKRVNLERGGLDGMGAACSESAG